MFFTIVIPAYNCEDTIDRLLKSIDANAGDLKVIICDDSDKDHDISDQVEQSRCAFPIEYYQREDSYHIHCPGNTRHSGLHKALQEDTEYILFADCDDEFYADKLSEIKEALIEGGMPDVVATKFDVYEPDGSFSKTEPISLGWLHGKFYRKDFLLRHGIQFEIDMATHEDTYFNSLVTYYSMVDNIMTAQIDDVVFYKWHRRLDSITHKNRDEIYIQRHYHDFLYACIDVFMYRIKADGITDAELLTRFAVRCAHSIFSAYCYFQGFASRGDRFCSQVGYRKLKKTIWTYCQTFHLTQDDLIKVIYSDPVKMIQHRNISYAAVGYYIEQESFRDFISRMRFYE